MTAVPSRGSSTHRRAVALCRGRAGPASALLAVVALSGCGGGLNGTYTPSSDGFFEQLTFQSGGTVEITWMGMTKEASYDEHPHAGVPERERGPVAAFPPFAGPGNRDAESNGDRVIVRLPEEEPFELVRQGDVLEGPASFAGTVIRFRRK